MTAASRTSATHNPPRPEQGGLKFAVGYTSVGSVLVASGAKGVAAIIIQQGTDTRPLVGAFRRHFPLISLQQRPMTRELRQVVEFIERPDGNLSFPLDIRGTAFQRRVWAAVLTVPFGQTTTFAAIAAKIGSPKAVRAVGNACSHNPLEFAIPCHRVLRSDGSFSGGSAWGDRRQSTLVMREAAARENRSSRKRKRRPPNRAPMPSAP
jgi:AraC family transcriptional regulator, regulatory protein of adaptative response / methylated-DNA-[protein]-cysteine methyltransferase